MAVVALLATAFTVEGSRLNSLKTPITLAQLSGEKPSILAQTEYLLNEDGSVHPQTFAKDLSDVATIIGLGKDKWDNQSNKDLKTMWDYLNTISKQSVTLNANLGIPEGSSLRNELNLL